MEAQIFQEQQSKEDKSTYATRLVSAVIDFKHNLPLPNFYCRIERIKINE